LKALLDPKKQEEIKERQRQKVEWLKKNRKDKRLVETLGGMEVDDDAPKACLICQL
jgi:flagellar motility protein MotE (MotC chaperone)